MYNRFITAALIVMALGLGAYAVIQWAEQRALRIQAEQAVKQLSQTLIEQQAKHEQTDRMLADTARQRFQASERAKQLAAQLAEVGECAATDIPAAVADRVREYRDSLQAGASAPIVD